MMFARPRRWFRRHLRSHRHTRRLEEPEKRYDDRWDGKRKAMLPAKDHQGHHRTDM